MKRAMAAAFFAALILAAAITYCTNQLGLSFWLGAPIAVIGGALIGIVFSFWLVWRLLVR